MTPQKGYIATQDPARWKGGGKQYGTPTQTKKPHNQDLRLFHCELSKSSLITFDSLHTLVTIQPQCHTIIFDPKSPYKPSTTNVPL